MRSKKTMKFMLPTILYVFETLSLPFTPIYHLHCHSVHYHFYHSIQHQVTSYIRHQLMFRRAYPRRLIWVDIMLLEIIDVGSVFHEYITITMHIKVQKELHNTIQGRATLMADPLPLGTTPVGEIQNLNLVKHRAMSQSKKKINIGVNFYFFRKTELNM